MHLGSAQRSAGKARRRSLAAFCFETGRNMTHAPRTTKCFCPRGASLTVRWGIGVQKCGVFASTRPHGPVGLYGAGKEATERVHRTAANTAATAVEKDEKTECAGRGRRRGCANCDRRTAVSRLAVPRRSRSAAAERESPRAPRCSGRCRPGSSPPACRRYRPRAPAFEPRR